jgi:hypothetical protein
MGGFNGMGCANPEQLLRNANLQQEAFSLL